MAAVVPMVRLALVVHLVLLVVHLALVVLLVAHLALLVVRLVVVPAWRLTPETS